MIRIRRLAALALTLAAVVAAKEDPVQWTLSPVSGEPVVAPGGTAYYKLKAAIQSGWHLYSPTTPPGGPIITKIQVTSSPAVAAYKIYRPQPIRKLDPNFNLDTETYAGSADFLIEISAAKTSSATTDVDAVVRYQVCSDVKCLPPVQKTVPAALHIEPGAPRTSFSMPPGYLLVPRTAQATPPASQVSTRPSSFAPPAATSEGLVPFLLTAFGFGLAALFTPCVFPMIPITISFFVNQNAAEEQRRRGWMQALVFCLGIIVLFTGLGFLVTAIAGPFGVVQLGSSPWVNGFIALVFLIFGLSLLGAFELRLPSGVLTRLSGSGNGGYGGTLLMGLTFSLTSFACIGPIVGPLLIASVQSKGALPVLGMLAFATGLAAPFFFLALFPAYLERLPRSGAWMLRVKIVLGFVVLAVMLKYLSNIDQVFQAHWLTRERFLAAWIVLFALPGFYLLGLLAMEGIKREERVGVARALVAALFLIFSISLIPGLFGGRLGDLDAFIPESSGNLFNISGNQTASESSTRYTNQLDRALAAAKEQNKLILVDFTGYACTNCHWMKANMFPRPEIQAALKDLIVVDLYTDGTDAESAKNQRLEDQKFGTASIPFYAILDANQNVIATFPQLTRNTQEFLAFLESKPGSGTQTAMLR